MTDDTFPMLEPSVSEEVELRIKFAGYIERQERAVARTAKLESLALPIDLDYSAIIGMRNHARTQLARVRPLTLGQAGRVEGVTPADISAILIWLQRAPSPQAATPATK